MSLSETTSFIIRREYKVISWLTKNTRVVGEWQLGVVDLDQGFGLVDEGVLLPSTHPPDEVAGLELRVRRVDHLTNSVIRHGLI